MTQKINRTKINVMEVTRTEQELEITESPTVTIRVSFVI